MVRDQEVEFKRQFEETYSTVLMNDCNCSGIVALGLEERK